MLQVTKDIMDKTGNNIFEGMTSVIDVINKVGRVLPLRLEAGGSNRIHGLVELCKKYISKKMIIVEIGSFAGVSTWALAYHARNVIAIEPHGDFAAGLTDDSDIQSADSHTKGEDYTLDTVIKSFEYMLTQNRNVKFLKMLSKDAAEIYGDSSVDGVYIDASHNFKDVLNDLQLWYPKVVSGGLISGHDWGYRGVAQAVIQFLNAEAGWGPTESKLRIDLSFSDTSWAFIKP